MIAGYHLIWTAYGWWLPNDPRGSTSHSIRSASLSPLGDLHYGRKRIQPAGRLVREFYEAARGHLQHPLLKLSDDEIATIAAAFADVIAVRNYTCYGCVILPDHVHLLLRKHLDRAETMIANLQQVSREAVLAKPQAARGANHPVWAGPGWKVYSDSRADMERIVKYIGDNPRKAGRADQCWGFVRQYDGWLPGQVRIVKRAKPQASDKAGEE